MAYSWVFATEQKAPLSLDILVDLVRRDTGASMTAVTFVNDDAQRLYARSGTDLDRTTAAASICRHVIATGDELLIPDLSADPRALEAGVDPGAPQRAYAGFPINNDRGRTVAVLCAQFAGQPPPEDALRETMRNFAVMASDIIENQRCARLLERTREGVATTAAALEREVRRTRLASTEADIGFWEIDLASRKISWSDNLYAMFGMTERRAMTVPEVLEYLTEASQQGSTEAVADTSSGQRFDLILELADKGADYLIDCRGERTQDVGGRDIMTGIMRRVPKLD